MAAGGRGFKVGRSRGFRIRRTEYKDGRVSSNAQLFYNQGKWTIGPKRGGRRSAREEAVWGNLYYEQGGVREIERFYSKKYSKIRSTENIRGIRTNEGVGWLTREGRIILEREMKMIFRSLDKTVVGGPAVDRIFDSENRIYEMGILESKWESLTPREKAEVVDEFRNMDWDAFWKEFYPSKERQSSQLRVMYQMYDDIVLRMNEAINRV